MSQTFSQTALLTTDLCRSSGSSSLMFELHPCALCYLHIHRSEFEMCSAGECEGLTEGGLKIHTLYIDTAASRSGVVWRFSFLIRLSLTVAKTLNIPSCQFFSLFTVFTFSSILWYIGAGNVTQRLCLFFVRSRYPPAPADAVESESGSGSGGSRQRGVCQISRAASGAERWQ